MGRIVTADLACGFEQGGGQVDRTPMKVLTLPRLGSCGAFVVGLVRSDYALMAANSRYVLMTTHW